MEMCFNLSCTRYIKNGTTKLSFIIIIKMRFYAGARSFGQIHGIRIEAGAITACFTIKSTCLVYNVGTLFMPYRRSILSDEFLDESERFHKVYLYECSSGQWPGGVDKYFSFVDDKLVIMN